jgi:hypothetical protein
MVKKNRILYKNKLDAWEYVVRLALLDAVTSAKTNPFDSFVQIRLHKS